MFTLSCKLLTTQETTVNHGTKTTGLPDLTANLLREGKYEVRLHYKKVIFASSFCGTGSG